MVGIVWVCACVCALNVFGIRIANILSSLSSCHISVTWFWNWSSPKKSWRRATINDRQQMTNHSDKRTWARTIRTEDKVMSAAYVQRKSEKGKTMKTKKSKQKTDGNNAQHACSMLRQSAPESEIGANDFELLHYKWQTNYFTVEFLLLLPPLPRWQPSMLLLLLLWYVWLICSWIVIEHPSRLSWSFIGDCYAACMPIRSAVFLLEFNFMRCNRDKFLCFCCCCCCCCGVVCFITITPRAVFCAYFLDHFDYCFVICSVRVLLLFVMASVHVCNDRTACRVPKMSSIKLGCSEKAAEEGEADCVNDKFGIPPMTKSFFVRTLTLI